MSNDTQSRCEAAGCGKTKAFFLGIIIIACLLITGGLIQMVVRYATPAPLGQDRAAFRAKSLAELRAANAETLSTYAYVDQQRGIVRLPIEQSMKLIIAEWQDPSAGRAVLLSREAQATKPLPKAPAKPSEFE